VRCCGSATNPLRCVPQTTRHPGRDHRVKQAEEFLSTEDTEKTKRAA
jgi:hypothetical protein